MFIFKKRKLISYLTLQIILFLIVFYCFPFLGEFSAQAQTPTSSIKKVTTSVTVGNSAPSFSVAPVESPASSVTSPTNVDSDVTFKATAADANGDNYYLAICKTNSITTNNSSAPTCGGGSWCISSSTASGSQASCSYTALQGDAESNDWHAFVCDHNSSSLCSAVSQGSGDSGSPFKVNHPPVFDIISNNVGAGGTNPGDTVTWSTNASTKDNDVDISPDTVKLVICKTEGVSGTDCDGGESDRWCASGWNSGNPSCSFNLPIPMADTLYNAYAYLFDSHNLAATDANQGANSSFTVLNVAPVISNVTLNDGADIVLTEGTTTSVVLGATVTDNNGCSEITSVVSSLYRSGVGFSGCDDEGKADDNKCYSLVTCSTSNCSGAQATYTCAVNVQYHADPTVTGTKYPEEDWKNTFQATDHNSAIHSLEITKGVEMEGLIAMNVPENAIPYGNLSVGQTNPMVSTYTTVQATGNVGLNEELSGTDMTCSAGGCSGKSIAVGQQKYALSPAIAYAEATALSSTPVNVLLRCLKTTASVSPQSKLTYWGLFIPESTMPGTYSGENTIVAAMSSEGDW